MMMTIIVLVKHNKDPRQHRIVVDERGVHSREVCERDALGVDSWRKERDAGPGSVHAPPMRSEDLIGRALRELAIAVVTGESTAGVTIDMSDRKRTIIDLGTVRP